MPWASHMPRNISGKRNCSTGTGENSHVKIVPKLRVQVSWLSLLRGFRGSKLEERLSTMLLSERGRWLMCVQREQCNPQTVCTGFTGASRRFRVSISYFREIFMHVWTSHVPTHPPTYPSPYACHLTLRAAASLHERSVTPSILRDRDAALGCHPD